MLTTHLFWESVLTAQPKMKDTAMTKVDVDFRLHGVVNEKPFDMNGYGSGDRSCGTCELHLEAAPEFPEGFDPVSCPLICSHPTSSYFARAEMDCVDLASIAAGPLAVAPARIGMIYDADGELLLNLAVTGTVELIGDQLVIVNEMRGFSRLPRLRRNVTPLRDYILPSGPGRATAVIRYQLETESGALLDGVTTVPYCWEGDTVLPEPLVREVKDIRVAWDGARRVSAYYDVAVTPLYEGRVSRQRPEKVFNLV
jgi:hypothetical protein